MSFVYQNNNSGSKLLLTVAASACALLIMLAGCGQNANDEKVASEKQTAMRRVDQFQAVASNEKIAVVVGGRVVVVSDLQSGSVVRIVLPSMSALIDVVHCADGSFAALDFYRRIWVANSEAKVWTPRELKGTWRPLALTCDTQNRLWVVGSGTTLASSVDKGASWQLRDFKQDAMFNTVQFVDANNGFITGEFGAVYRTLDSGVSWNAEAKIPNEFYPYAAVFISATEGYVSGLAGVMLQTKDAGKNWVKLENPSGLPQFGLTRRGGVVYSVGIGGSLQRLENQRWQSIDYGVATPAYLRAVTPIGADRLLVAGAAGVMRIISLNSIKSTIAKEE